MNLNLNHAWLALGIAFILFSVPTMISHPNMGSFISIACGVLVMYSSLKPLGGWKIMFRNLFR